MVNSYRGAMIDAVLTDIASAPHLRDPKPRRQIRIATLREAVNHGCGRAEVFHDLESSTKSMPCIFSTIVRIMLQNRLFVSLKYHK
ncbi:hypothetical protein WM40_15570 [Robbsia andropogonis]|uniref:Uncharacterized protein n=1 Tax=Robbsia andropogonis TaxID=28092 RepID=A0A0F5JXW2_9BURK|nr:hypothetical protein WM40_15570 [Robbsia andropogonis]